MPWSGPMGARPQPLAGTMGERDDLCVLCARRASVHLVPLGRGCLRLQPSRSPSLGTVGGGRGRAEWGARRGGRPQEAESRTSEIIPAPGPAVSETAGSRRTSQKRSLLCFGSLGFGVPSFVTRTVSSGMCVTNGAEA